jgi:hypothetical protein
VVIGFADEHDVLGAGIPPGEAERSADDFLKSIRPYSGIKVDGSDANLITRVLLDREQHRPGGLFS